MSLNFVQGDTAPDVTAVLHSEDDPTEVLNMTAAGVDFVRFQMRKQDDHRYTVNSAATIVDPLLGKVSYSWGANDLAVAGTYYAQWEITYLGGRVQTTTPEVMLIVRRQ